MKFVSMKEKKDGTVSFGNDGSSNVIGSRYRHSSETKML